MKRKKELGDDGTKATSLARDALRAVGLKNEF